MTNCDSVQTGGCGRRPSVCRPTACNLERQRTATKSLRDLERSWTNTDLIETDEDSQKSCRYECTRTQLRNGKYSSNSDSLLKVPIFTECSNNFIDFLSRSTETRIFQDAEIIFIESSYGNQMYIVIHGAVDVIVGETHVAKLSEGAVFGEMAALCKNPIACKRNATVQANGVVDCRVISREILNHATSNFPEDAAILERVSQSRLHDLKTKGLSPKKGCQECQQREVRRASVIDWQAQAIQSTRRYRRKSDVCDRFAGRDEWGLNQAAVVDQPIAKAKKLGRSKTFACDTIDSAEPHLLPLPEAPPSSAQGTNHDAGSHGQHSLPRKNSADAQKQSGNSPHGQHMLVPTGDETGLPAGIMGLDFDEIPEEPSEIPETSPALPAPPAIPARKFLHEAPFEIPETSPAPPVPPAPPARGSLHFMPVVPTSVMRNRSPTRFDHYKKRLPQIALRLQTFDKRKSQQAYGKTIAHADAMANSAVIRVARGPWGMCGRSDTEWLARPTAAFTRRARMISQRAQWMKSYSVGTSANAFCQTV